MSDALTEFRSKGGKARAAKLSPARRAEIARLGGLARQKGRKKRKGKVPK